MTNAGAVLRSLHEGRPPEFGTFFAGLASCLTAVADRRRSATAHWLDLQPWAERDSKGGRTLLMGCATSFPPHGGAQPRPAPKQLVFPTMAGLSEKKKQQLLRDAAPALSEGEEVIDFTTGSIEVRRMGTDTKRQGTVIVTDRRVILFSKKLGGYDVQDYAYGLLTSVDHKKGIAFGNLDLAAAGDRSRITLINKDDIERIAQAIRQRVAQTHRPGNASSADVADQIRKLAALRDEGILSSDEFEAKKRQLLGL